MRALAVESLSVRGFRNLTSVDIELGPRFNVLSGDNGQGKTNLLEAAYVLATTRSFRTPKIAEIVGEGSQTASVKATVREASDARVQSVGLRRGMRVARIDDKRPETLASYAVRVPCVVFHPGMLALSSGAGQERRRLLDRIALYQTPSSLAEAASYGKALRSRQRVLETRGESASDLDGWEELVVRHGLALGAHRASAAALLAPTAEQAFERLGPADLRLAVRYLRGAPEDPQEFRVALQTRRPRDRARGAASVGPHRDDLSLVLGGRPVRTMASQGQHRAVVLALEVAEMRVIAETTGVQPLLLLDDVSGELDRSRTTALFASLREEQGQVLLTTTRPELIDTRGVSAEESRRDFTVESGRISPA